MISKLVSCLRRMTPAWSFILIAAISHSPSLAQDANLCDVAGEAPDIVVGDLSGVQRFGTVGNISGYSVGTISCNVGTCWANWESSTSDHPVIGQNLYRLKDGRFEQIGQSWVKHGFFALSQTFCSGGCVSGDGSHLGVNCSDPYSSGLNGSQARLGPRSEVNPTTGEFLFPFTTIDQTGDDVYKRLQVHNDDLDPSLNPGAVYFVEAQYIAADDAAAGNGDNNASYREVVVTGSNGVYDIAVIGGTVRERPAVYGWKEHDPSIKITTFKVPGDGLFTVVSHVTDLGDGFFRYEYSVHNLDSNRAGGSFRVPIPEGTTVTNIGFHDVAYHSGEPYDGTDWVGSVVTEASGSSVLWSTEPHGVDPNANALRWGTLYNFRFEADVPALITEVTVGLFIPGIPDETTGLALAPSPCNSDGICQPGEDCSNCADCLLQVPQPGICGDGVCEPTRGEDCLSCEEDCNGVQSGSPAGRFCCGDGDGSNPVD